MNDFETIIAQTLFRLRELEASHRELANALPEDCDRKQYLLQEAERAAETIKEVAEMYRRCMSS